MRSVPDGDPSDGSRTVPGASPSARGPGTASRFGFNNAIDRLSPKQEASASASAEAPLSDGTTVVSLPRPAPGP